MSYFVCDVEADSQTPAFGSMVCFGAVLVNDDLDKTFYGQTKPITPQYNEDNLAISGFSRKEHEKFDDPEEVMLKFREWVMSNTKGQPIFMTDNPGFDFAWINYYFQYYQIKNPFGWSSRRIGDIFCGFYNDAHYSWKKHRDNKRFPHNHHPVSDACGNASALLWLKSQGFKIQFK